MVETVKIELNEEDVIQKTDSEKLNTLIKIAFANHQQLAQQGMILFGNGDPKSGLCYKVALQGSKLGWLITAVSIVSSFVVGTLVKHIIG